MDYDLATLKSMRITPLKTIAQKLKVPDYTKYLDKNPGDREKLARIVYARIQEFKSYGNDSGDSEDFEDAQGGASTAEEYRRALEDLALARESNLCMLKTINDMEAREGHLTAANGSLKAQLEDLSKSLAEVGTGTTQTIEQDFVDHVVALTQTFAQQVKKLQEQKSELESQVAAAQAAKSLRKFSKAATAQLFAELTEATVRMANCEITADEYNRICKASADAAGK